MKGIKAEKKGKFAGEEGGRFGKDVERGNEEVFQPLEKFFPIIGKMAKIFSNRWKTREKFFQSLENSGGVFQPLEKMFPIIGKFAGYKIVQGCRCS